MDELKEFFKNAREDNLTIGYSIEYRGYKLIYDKKNGHNIIEIWGEEYINDSAVDKLDIEEFDKWKKEIDSIIEFGCQNIQDWREWSENYEAV